MKQVLNAVNVRDPETKEFKSLPALMGPSAYDIAKKGGYTGSEEEFGRLQAAFADAYDRVVTVSKTNAEQMSGVLPINADLLQGKTTTEFVEHRDALTLEEIEASTSLEGKVASAQAVRQIKLDLVDLNTIYTGSISFPSGYADLITCRRVGNVVMFGARMSNMDVPYGSPVMILPEGFRPKDSTYVFVGCSLELDDGNNHESSLFSIFPDGCVYQEKEQRHTRRLTMSCIFVI